MARQYSDDLRREYLRMLNRMDQHWLAVLDQNTEFGADVYWDLLTGLWRQDRPVSKSEVLKSMTSVKSLTTARKYLRSVQQQGWIHEVDHPTDTRFRLVMLSPGARTRLDAFFDAAICELVDTNRVIGQMERPPEHPT
jgi:hypothetical protein